MGGAVLGQEHYWCYPRLAFLSSGLLTSLPYSSTPYSSTLPYYYFYYSPSHLSFAISVQLYSCQFPIHAYAISLASDPSPRKTAALTVNARHVNSRRETPTADRFVFLFKAVAGLVG